MLKNIENFKAAYFQKIIQDAKNLSTLSELSLPGKLSQEELQQLIDALGSNSYIKSLKINYSEIGDEGVAQLLSKIDFLVSLDASYCKITDKGAQIIAQKKIIALNLQGNRIGENGAIALAKNNYLRTLNIRGNPIGQAGIEALAKSPSLTSINFAFCQINAVNISTFQQNYRLLSIDISNNNISEEDKGKLIKIVHRNNTCEFIGIIIILARNITKHKLSPFTLLSLDLLLHIISFVDFSKMSITPEVGRRYASGIFQKITELDDLLENKKDSRPFFTNLLKPR